MKRLLVFLSVALVVGCGGSGGGGGSAAPAKVATFISDSMDGNDHVWVTVFKIQFTTASGSTTVFDSATGVQVDLKTLRDSTGARFRFMSNDDVPAGTITGAVITLDKNLVVFGAGATTGTPMTFDSSLDVAGGKSALTLTFPSPIVENENEDDDIVIDFDLADWNETANVVTPVLKLGTESGLNDGTRHEDGELEGTVENLSGAAPTQTFTLHTEDANDINVATDANTQVETENGATLANGGNVQVEGTFDTTTNTFKASELRIRNPEDVNNDTEDVDGSVSSFDGTAATIVIGIDNVDGFLPNATTITIDASGAATQFFDTNGASVTKDAFFAALSNGMRVKAIGTLDVGSGHFIASQLWIKHED